MNRRTGHEEKFGWEEGDGNVIYVPDDDVEPLESAEGETPDDD